MGRLWEGIQELSEKRGPLRLPSVALVCLVEQGPAEFAWRVRSRLGGRNKQRQYYRSLHFSEEELRDQRETVFPSGITISILAPLYNTPLPFLTEMMDSVRTQTYGKWELCLADGSDDEHAEVGEACRRAMEQDPRIRYRKLEKNGGISANTNACLEMATGEYIALFDHDDLLRENALYEMMKAIEATKADFLYSDEAVFASPKRKDIIGFHFKPDFALDNLLTNNYICHLTVFSRELMERAGRFRPAYDGSQDHDLFLRLTDEARKVVHIPRVLYFWRSHPTSVAGDIGSKTYAVEAGRSAVRDFLAGKGIEAEVESSPVYPTMYRVKYALRGLPKVSVILLPATETAEAEAQKAAVREATDYPNLEIRVAERAPEGGAQTGKDSRAARLNRAAEQAEGDYLVFLAPGLRIETKEWIQELLMLCQQEHAGAVGGRVLFDENRVRHAGIILGLGWHGAAGRSYFRIQTENLGYYGTMAIVEDMAAVSAECMMVRNDRFREVGGFDPELGSCLYDADLCLKLYTKGWLNMETPYAVARGGGLRQVHLELGREQPGYEAAAALFRKRWAELLEKGDPFYNPSFSLSYGDYRLRSREPIGGLSDRPPNPLR